MNMKNNYLYICICLLLITTVPSHAQKEANNWFFGYNCALTWKTTRSWAATGMNTPDSTLLGLPTSLIGGALNTDEGCFSLSDSEGQLLCYSNGINIYNRNNQLMPNGSGMSGHNSSTQSGIVIPYPGQIDKYIAVTIDYNTNDLMCYSVIDMSLQNGLGDIVSTQKNIAFQGHSGLLGETVTSVQHANGIDYWVLAPGRGDPTYLNAWLVTASGVSTTPITTTLPFSNTVTNVSGTMKLTSDGNYFAWATSSYRKVLFGEFDPATGSFSNVKAIDNLYAYALEFSASAKYLYVSAPDVNGTYNPTGRMLYTYKFADLLNAADPNTVSRNEYQLSFIGTQQLGPDGRMYIASRGDQFIYVIVNPEEYDNLKIFKLENNFLGVGRQSRLGLPSFASSWFKVNVQGEETFCVNTPQTFNLVMLLGMGTDIISHTEWDFGDGSEIIKNYNVENPQTQTHTYTKAGDYTITVKMYRQSDGSEVTERRVSRTFNANPCAMPVNPNIHFISPSGGNED